MPVNLSLMKNLKKEYASKKGKAAMPSPKKGAKKSMPKYHKYNRGSKN